MGKLVLAIFVAAGCTPDVTAPNGTGPQPVVGTAAQARNGRLTEHPTVPFADIELTSTGTIRPGEPLQIEARLTGRVAATGVRLTLERLDLPISARAANQGRTHTTLRDWQGGLGSAATSSISSPITYDAPGYYRVLATATASPTGKLPDGTHVRNQVSRTLWVYVTPEGGRLTEGWDSTVVDPAYRFEYGAYGVRFPRPTPRPVGKVEGLAMGSQATVQGSVKYIDPSIQQERGVRGGQLSVVCLGRSSPEVLEWDLSEGPSVSSVSSTGDFTVVCPDGFEYAEAEYSMKGFVSEGKGKNGAMAGSSFAAFTGTTGNLVLVNNNTAASSFSIMEEFVPQAFTKFGTSRPSMLIWASDIAEDPDSKINYCPMGCGGGSVEIVRMEASRAFGEEGTFVVMHEYGHGFQYVAIEQWGDACSGPHFIDQVSSLSCAFVEGFADFFSVWVAGGVLTSGSVATYNDHRAETNVERGFGNGSTIEGAVAGFLYDLVDGPADPNGPQNENGTDDDQVTWPASLIVQAFQNCALRDASTGTWHTILDGIDQVIYCLDTPDVSPPFDPQTAINPATNQRYFVTGRSYDLISVSAFVPPTWNKVQFRQLWLFNLFNQGGL